jgi:hypothetical protein
MGDRIKTIGTGQDYLDPILWAAAEGNINDGDRAVGVLKNNVQMTALFRPNQSFPNMGLLKGDITVTGEPGICRELTSTAGTRIILAPSDNLDYEDLLITPNSSQSYGIQLCGNTTMNRVIINGDEIYSINMLPGKTATLNNFVGKFLVVFSSSSNAEFDCNNVLLTGRALIQANPSMIRLKNGISIASDWLLGRGTYVGSDTLVNYSKILQNAPLGDFGPGSDNYEVDYDATNDFIDLAGKDYRIKAGSPLATAGENGTYIGPFLESGIPPVTYKWYWTQNFSGTGC